MSIEIDYFTEITPNIYIGTRSSLYKYHLFDVVVDMANPSMPDGVVDIKNERGIKLYRSHLPDIQHIMFENDMYHIINKILPDLLELYKENDNIRILFHCKAGVSRSVSIALAFLCKSKNMEFDEALSYIISKRSIANPNPSFINAVKKYIKDYK